MPRTTREEDFPRDKRMPPDLARALMEHSPRLVITRPTLVRVTDSPTGWLVVTPDLDEADNHERPALDPDDLPDPIVPSPPDAALPEHNYDAWIGRYVYVDGDSEPVGPIVDVFYDVGTQRPEWVVIGDTRWVAPLALSHIGGDWDDLYLGFTRDRIEEAPTLPADGFTVEDEQDLYTYYGFDWNDPVPVPLPARWDDGWDTNWGPHPTPQPRPGPTSLSPRMTPFTPAVTVPPPPPDDAPVSAPEPE